jgi:hypothetical protein
MLFGRVRFLALLAIAVAVATRPLGAQTDMAPAIIAAADPFSALVGKSRPAEARRVGGVQRYAVASDGRVFLVEGKVGRARLKYLCTEGDQRLDCSLDPEAYAEEIFIATGARGPRGDVIYKDASGNVLLRLMSYGGATVFWPGKSNGEAASRSYGEEGALNLPPATWEDARRRAGLAAERLGAIAGGSFVFSIEGAEADAPAPGAAAASSGDATVLADAIVRAAAGMADVARDETGARALRERVSKATFVRGVTPKLSLDGKSLIVVYNPSEDAAGRPSSRAVREFLENSL